MSSTPKPNCVSKFSTTRCLALACGLLCGCATPQYAIRQTPIPEESPAAIQIERTISAIQAQGFAREGARPIGVEEELWGFRIQEVLDRLSRLTERPHLSYRAYLYGDRDPNAAALADGRVYLSTGMLDYLASRGSRPDEPFDSALPRSGRMPSEVEAELAFILSHELAHTVAQHLVKRYRLLQQQQLILALVAAGASAVTREGTAGVQQMGRLAVDAASVVANVAATGYSQEQELEADQLGIRYVIRAGYNPVAALELLGDFSRFDTPWPFLRTHPYITQRRADLERYLMEIGALGAPLATPSVPPTRRATDERRQRLLDAQKLYPVGSVSWKNLQRQLDNLQNGGVPF